MRQRELRLELPLLEALLLGRHMLGHPPRPTRPHRRRMSGDLPQPTAPDLRLPQHPLMAGRVMATAQGLTRILRSSILPREGGAEPNRTVINFAGRHSGDSQQSPGVRPSTSCNAVEGCFHLV